jgi:hypothetical protein
MHPLLDLIVIWSCGFIGRRFARIAPRSGRPTQRQRFEAITVLQQNSIRQDAMHADLIAQGISLSHNAGVPSVIDNRQRYGKTGAHAL